MKLEDMDMASIETNVKLIKDTRDAIVSDHVAILQRINHLMDNLDMKWLDFKAPIDSSERFYFISFGRYYLYAKKRRFKHHSDNWYLHSTGPRNNMLNLPKSFFQEMLWAFEKALNKNFKGLHTEIEFCPHCGVKRS